MLREIEAAYQIIGHRPVNRLYEHGMVPVSKQRLDKLESDLREQQKTIAELRARLKYTDG